MRADGMAVGRACCRSGWVQPVFAAICRPARPPANGRKSSVPPATAKPWASAWPIAGPAAGPKLVWQRSVGSGYAGVAVAGGRVVLFHRVGDEAIAEALDAAHAANRSGNKRFRPATGRRSPPTTGRCACRWYTMAECICSQPKGTCYCLRLDSGEKVWSRQADRQFKAPLGYFGAGSTPIVEKDMLLVNVGAPGAGMVAFRLADGEIAWQATDEAASYSSPTAATIGGARHAIFVTRLNVVSVEPATGKVQFQFPFGMRGPTVNAATPLVLGDELFVTANYGVGARLVNVAGEKPKMVWIDDDVMSSQYTTLIELAGTLYGIHGRQDLGVAKLRAVDPQTKKIYWTEDDFGTGNLILADGKLLIMKTDGKLILAEPSTKEYRELASAKIFDGVVQPLPALADGKLYVRDTKTLKCLDVAAPTKAAR